MKRINDLTHEQFKEFYEQGKIDVRANMSISMHACDRDPRISRPVRAAHHFWKWVGLLMFVSGPVSIFIIKWYYGLGILLLSVMVINATRQSAGQFVVRTALEDESFYYDMLANNVLLITER